MSSTTSDATVWHSVHSAVHEFLSASDLHVLYSRAWSARVPEYLFRASIHEVHCLIYLICEGLCKYVYILWCASRLCIHTYTYYFCVTCANVHVHILSILWCVRKDSIMLLPLRPICVFSPIYVFAYLLLACLNCCMFARHFLWDVYAGADIFIPWAVCPCVSIYLHTAWRMGVPRHNQSSEINRTCVRSQHS
jgi:hypothetical protein